MGVRKYKPTTPGRRGASVSTFDELTRNRPEKKLVAKGRNKAGRNVHGRIRRGTRARRHEAPLPRDRFPSQQGRRAGRSRTQYDLNRRRASRCCITPTARSATSSRPRV
jgi:large subunit ribosomal protein L2